MSVELTPRGTRGATFPKWLMPVMKVFGPAGNAMMRRAGAKLLELTTTGARTGLERTVTLAWFPDEPDTKDTWLVIAAYAGAAQHPAWYINMAKNPDKVWITIGGQKIHVKPASLKGAEREETWNRIVAKAKGYADYQTKTDREIPVVRLRRG